MPKMFTPDEVRRLAGQFSKECAIEVLRAGSFGARMTRANFSAHKACIKRKFEEEIRRRIGTVAR